MYMSESEIIGKFRKADNKNEMLQILADLNGCSKSDIKSYLLEHGVSEDDFPKRGRKTNSKERKETKSNAAKEEIKKSVKEEVPHMEPVKTVAQLMEMSELTQEEQSNVDRALEIPEPVRRAVADRIESLTAKIMELENERDCLCDYLEGVVHNDEAS